MKKSTTVVVLVLFALGGMALRFAASGDRYLWNDEAETTINALQVLDVGYPNSTFEGKPIYENASYIPSDDPKYAYESTNYYGSTYERNKGWLTYYYQAAFLKVFGFSTFNARLPFVLLFPAVLFVLYVLGKRLFNEKVALIASFILSVDWYSVMFTRQARYYALVVLLALLCLYAFYRAVTERRWRFYLLSALGLTLLFYTHIVASIAVGIFFILVHVYHSGGVRILATPKVLATVFIPVLLAIPWLVLVEFWTVFDTFSGTTTNVVWLFVIAIVVFAYFFVKYFMPQLVRFNLYRFSSVNYLILFTLTIFTLKPIVTPGESHGYRIFLELNAVMCLLFACWLYNFIKQRAWTYRRWRLANAAVPLLVLLVSFFGIVGFTSGVGDTKIYDTDWVRAAIVYLDERHIPKDAEILVTDQQMPFMLYSDYNVDLVWPIRKSYLDGHSGGLYFIFHYQVLHMTRFYREEVLQQIGSWDRLTFYDKLQACEPAEIYPDTYFYDCAEAGLTP
ncbi:MAG: glycosyltransferase family 39 protein [Patescibacteria group bacterium]